jgi:hypothetical protein
MATHLASKVHARGEAVRGQARLSGQGCMTTNNISRENRDLKRRSIFGSSSRGTIPAKSIDRAPHARLGSMKRVRDHGAFLAYRMVALLLAGKVYVPVGIEVAGGSDASSRPPRWPERRIVFSMPLRAAGKGDCMSRGILGSQEYAQQGDSSAFIRAPARRVRSRAYVRAGSGARVCHPRRRPIAFVRLRPVLKAYTTNTNTTA